MGLSWKIIMHIREEYKQAFHNFDIDACAAMTGGELEALMDNDGIIRNKNKLFSVKKNAQIVKALGGALVSGSNKRKNYGLYTDIETSRQECLPLSRK